MIVVVMGVSGAGKTTVGQALARALGATFIEGDAFHPPENVAKMRRGEPLDDADREPWLRALSAELAAHADCGASAVLACSALKRCYRTILRAGAPDLRLVHLDGPLPVLRRRLEARAGHYMPASLLDSQLAILEPPADDEAGIRIDIDGEPAQIVADLLACLKQRPCPRQS